MLLQYAPQVYANMKAGKNVDIAAPRKTAEHVANDQSLDKVVSSLSLSLSLFSSQSCLSSRGKERHESKRRERTAELIPLNQDQGSHRPRPISPRQRERDDRPLRRRRGGRQRRRRRRADRQLLDSGVVSALLFLYLTLFSSPATQLLPKAMYYREPVNLYCDIRGI